MFKFQIPGRSNSRYKYIREILCTITEFTFPIFYQSKLSLNDIEKNELPINPPWMDEQPMFIETLRWRKKDDPLGAGARTNQIIQENYSDFT